MKVLFEWLQEELETTTETLSGVLEQPLSGSASKRRKIKDLTLLAQTKLLLLLDVKEGTFPLGLSPVLFLLPFSLSLPQRSYLLVIGRSHGSLQAGVRFQVREAMSPRGNEEIVIGLSLNRIT